VEALKCGSRSCVKWNEIGHVRSARVQMMALTHGMFCRSLLVRRSWDASKPRRATISRARAPDAERGDGRRLDRERAQS
jgi:hypothetical protein